MRFPAFRWPYIDYVASPALCLHMQRAADIIVRRASFSIVLGHGIVLDDGSVLRRDRIGIALERWQFLWQDDVCPIWVCRFANPMDMNHVRSLSKPWLQGWAFRQLIFPSRRNVTRSYLSHLQNRPPYPYPFKNGCWQWTMTLIFTLNHGVDSSFQILLLHNAHVENMTDSKRQDHLKTQNQRSKGGFGSTRIWVFYHSI